MGSFESTLAGAVHPALGDDDEHEQPPPGCNLSGEDSSHRGEPAPLRVVVLPAPDADMRPLDGMACTCRTPVALHSVRWRRLVSDASAGRRTAHIDSIHCGIGVRELILSLCSELDPVFSMWVPMNRLLRRRPMDRLTTSGGGQRRVLIPGRLRGRMGLPETPLYVSAATLGHTRWAVMGDAADQQRKSR